MGRWMGQLGTALKVVLTLMITHLKSATKGTSTKAAASFSVFKSFGFPNTVPTRGDERLCVEIRHHSQYNHPQLLTLCYRLQAHYVWLFLDFHKHLTLCASLHLYYLHLEETGLIVLQCCSRRSIQPTSSEINRFHHWGSCGADTHSGGKSLLVHPF